MKELLFILYICPYGESFGRAEVETRADGSVAQGSEGSVAEVAIIPDPTYRPNVTDIDPPEFPDRLHFPFDGRPRLEGITGS